MKLAGHAILASAIFAASLAGCSSDEKKKEAEKPATPAPAAVASTEPLRVERTVEDRVSATVKWINIATREVTLTDNAGHDVTITVDKSVQRLNEVKVGDEVVVNFVASLVGELREPTAEEKAHPIVAVAGAGRAPKTSDPAAGVAGAVRVVTTVQAIDIPNMRVTLRGPMGDMAVVKAQKKENIERLKINDTIVITYSEAMAVSLEKAKK